METWVHNNLLDAELIAILQTGYTNKSITLAWLDHFIKHVGFSSNVKHWHILLLDSHITHSKDDFTL